MIEEALHEEETEEYTEDTAELSGQDDLNSNAIPEPEAEEVLEESQLIQDINIESENEDMPNPVQEKMFKRKSLLPEGQSHSTSLC